MASRDIVVRLRAEIGNFRRDMQQAAQSSTALGTATASSARAMIGPMTQAQASAQATRQSLFDAGKAAQESAAGFGLSYNAAGRLTDQFGNIVTEAHAAELGLDTASEATREYAAQTTASAAEAAAAAAAATAASQSGISSLLDTAAANEEAWDKVGKGMATAGAAIMVGVGISIAKFAEFDKAMSSVDAATHETAGNMDLLREAAIAAGADTAFSAVEAAQGIEEMAKAGVSTKDILGGGLTGALSLAAAGALGVGEASEIAASAMTQFKLSGDKIPHLADLLAAGAGKAQGSVQDLGAALNQAGLVASQTGLSIEETVGGLAAFASAGMTGSDAGTSFKSMLQRLTPTSKEAAKLMGELGISAYDAQGDFIGLESFAGNLQESMKDLTVEQRNAAMGTIFGSDAVRAASVIYEQGAEGVGKWISAVDDAGYAAETAARMQDNLAGDIEKLGGAFDTLMIKSGEGPAEMLRGIVQAAESAVDALGKVPAPILSSVTAAAALVGGLALVGGAFITVVPKIAATRAALVAFNSSSGVVARNMGAIGKAAGVAAVGLIALGAAKVIVDNSQEGLVASSDRTTQALLGMGNSTKTVDELFRSFDGAGHFVADGIQGVGDALHRVENMDFNETMNKRVNDWVKIPDLLKPARDQILQIDESLAGLVTSGNADKAAEAFQKITKAGTDSGVAAETTAGHFTKYQDALRAQANTLKVALTDEEVYQWALGNTPPLIDAAMNSAEGQTAAAQAMAQANEETAEALAEVGLSADGTIQSLGKLLEAMFAAGLASMSANEATGSFHETLRGLDVKIQEVIASQGASNMIMNEAGTAFDATTKSGYAAVGVFNEVASKGQSMTQAMAENGATQGELQGALRTTYDSLVTTAIGLGASEEAARAMAREVLNIPDNANVDTAIQNYADSMAKLHGVGAAADALDGKTANVWVTTHNKSIYSEEHVSTGQGGSGGQTRWMGGLVGFAGGGVVPGVTPANRRHDNVLAMTQNGTPYRIQSGEMIVNTEATRKHYPTLKAINDGTYEAPSKSIGGGYGAQSFSASATSGGIDYGRLAAALGDRITVTNQISADGVVAARIADEIASKNSQALSRSLSASGIR